METGFDCEFANPIPEDTQTECPICLHILRRPHIVSCCGYRFCGGCLEAIQNTRASLGCPLCKQSFSATPDEGLERKLNAERVSCSFRKSGCPWIGELSRFESHLNSSPSSISRLGHNLLEGCSFFELVCPRCQDEPIQRQKMKNHIEDECPKREVVCLFCKIHRSSYEDMLQIHYERCPSLPVKCPRGCSAELIRGNVASHMDNECPNNPQPCPFSIVGCPRTFTQSQMTSHLSMSNKSIFNAHLSLVKEQVRDRDLRLTTLQREVTRVQEEIKSKRAEMWKLRAERSRSNYVQERRINEFKSELDEKCSRISVLTKNVDDKNRQIAELKRKSSCDDHSLHFLESENTALQSRIRAQEAEIARLRSTADEGERELLLGVVLCFAIVGVAALFQR